MELCPVYPLCPLSSPCHHIHSPYCYISCFSKHLCSNPPSHLPPHNLNLYQTPTRPTTQSILVISFASTLHYTPNLQPLPRIPLVLYYTTTQHNVILCYSSSTSSRPRRPHSWCHVHYLPLFSSRLLPRARVFPRGLGPRLEKMRYFLRHRIHS